MASLRFILYSALTSVLIVAVSSCATAPHIQPQINSFVVAEKYKQALTLLNSNEKNYGERNRLLYQMDYGLVLHLAGHYEKSIEVFEDAKKTFDRLITQSVSQIITTWVLNDNAADYRGEDFERVMINIFQSLNFARLRNFEEALVEARDVDSKLRVINKRYNLDQKNVYKEDAFARLLMGLLFEVSGRRTDDDDALISYRKAVDIYEQDYYPNYGLKTPRILKENILAMAQKLGSKDYPYYRKIFGDIEFETFATKSQKGEVYLIHYYGLSPVKHQGFVYLPLPGGYIYKLAFPQYDHRDVDYHDGIFKAVNRDLEVFQSVTEVAEDVQAIAIKNLENRKVRVVAKALVRSGAKYYLERIHEKKIRKRYGKETVRWFRYISSLYNIGSEQADLRSWQTLPSTILVARLILEPGEYELYFNNKELGKVDLKTGEKRFYITRTTD